MCGISVVYVKRRETKLIEGASEIGSSGWRWKKSSNNYQSWRHVLNSNDYILRTLGITDLPLRTSSPMDVDDVPVAKKRVSFDDHILYSDASLSSPLESEDDEDYEDDEDDEDEKEDEANDPSLHEIPECCHFRDDADVIFNNETEVIGEC